MARMKPSVVIFVTPSILKGRFPLLMATATPYAYMSETSFLSFSRTMSLSIQIYIKIRVPSIRILVPILAPTILSPLLSTCPIEVPLRNDIPSLFIKTFF